MDIWIPLEFQDSINQRTLVASTRAKLAVFFSDEARALRGMLSTSADRSWAKVMIRIDLFLASLAQGDSPGSPPPTRMQFPYLQGVQTVSMTNPVDLALGESAVSGGDETTTIIH